MKVSAMGMWLEERGWWFELCDYVSRAEVYRTRFHKCRAEAEAEARLWAETREYEMVVTG